MENRNDLDISIRELYEMLGLKESTVICKCDHRGSIQLKGAGNYLNINHGMKKELKTCYIGSDFIEETVHVPVRLIRKK